MMDWFALPHGHFQTPQVIEAFTNALYYLISKY
jgi:hypothetical protein